MDVLRRAFHEITEGRSEGKVLGKVAYIRHLSYRHQIEQDATKEAFHKQARDNGLPTNADRLVELKRTGEWSDANERDLVGKRTFLSGTREGKKTIKMPSLLKDIDRRIAEAEKDYDTCARRKYDLIGLTCESFADREMGDYYIHSNLFADSALTTPLFGGTEFDYFDGATMRQLIDEYNAIMDTCSDYHVRRLAMQPFFQGYMGLIGDRFIDMFGVPISRLTFYQVRLLNQGAHFRHIFQTHDVSQFPKDIQEDPDKLVDYAAAATKGKADLDAKGASDEQTIVMGVKKEDAKAMGLKNAGGNLVASIAANGGNAMDFFAKRGQAG